MKNFYQYLETITKQKINESDLNNNLKESIEKLSNNYRYNKEVRIIKTIDELKNFFIDKENWQKALTSSIITCFVIESNYDFYCISIDDINPPNKENIKETIGNAQIYKINENGKYNEKPIEEEINLINNDFFKIINNHKINKNNSNLSIEVYNNKYKKNEDINESVKKAIKKIAESFQYNNEVTIFIIPPSDSKIEELFISKERWIKNTTTSMRTCFVIYEGDPFLEEYYYYSFYCFTSDIIHIPEKNELHKITGSFKCYHINQTNGESKEKNCKEKNIYPVFKNRNVLNDEKLK